MPAIEAADRQGTSYKADELRRRISDFDWWYHTQELAPGILTPGMFDLRRDCAPPTMVAGARAFASHGKPLAAPWNGSR